MMITPIITLLGLLVIWVFLQVFQVNSLRFYIHNSLFQIQYN